jgi:Mrp family chromosome partitioning ATPase
MTTSRRQRAAPSAPIATVPLLMPPSQGGFLRRTQRIDSPFPGFARVCETATAVGNTDVAPFWSSIFRIADHVITGAGGERTRTCLLLGARGGIGTSTTALAVALSEAHAGSRVLLVDANGIDGDLASVFADPALRLPESDTVDAAGLAAITTRDTGSGLEFLAIPRVAIGARRRVRPAAVAAAILALAQRYDLVVVDGGVVGVEPLARLLGESADRLIVLDGTDRNAAEIAATLRNTGLADGRSGGLVLSEAGART